MAFDEKTFFACEKKILETPAELDRLEKRYHAFCDFCLHGKNAREDQDALRQRMYEYTQPMKDLCLIDGLLSPAERGRLPPVDRAALVERKEQAYHKMFMTLKAMKELG